MKNVGIGIGGGGAAGTHDAFGCVSVHHAPALFSCQIVPFI
jgi:hypothetical protein